MADYERDLGSGRAGADDRCCAHAAHMARHTPSVRGVKQDEVAPGCAERARVQGQTQRGQRRAGNRAAHLGVESPCRCAPACRLSAKSRPSSPRWIGLQTPTAPTSHVPHRLNTTGECRMFCATSAPSRLATLLRDEQARRPQPVSRHRQLRHGQRASSEIGPILGAHPKHRPHKPHASNRPSYTYPFFWLVTLLGTRNRELTLL